MWLLLLSCLQANAPEYYPIDTAQVLSRQLAGKVLVEYPTFLVLLPGEVGQYKLVSAVLPAADGTAAAVPSTDNSGLPVEGTPAAPAGTAAVPVGGTAAVPSDVQLGGLPAGAAAAAASVAAGVGGDILPTAPGTAVAVVDVLPAAAAATAPGALPPSNSTAAEAAGAGSPQT